jgi:ferredoxin
MTITEPAAPATERWTAQWKELYDEVITTGLCTGCAGCVVTCPHDVIGYEHEEGKYIPFHLEEELGLTNCAHGFGESGGCTTCTRACPRFRAWEPAADMHLFGRVREPDEMGGISFGKRIGEGTSQAVDRLAAVPAHDNLVAMLADVERALAKAEAEVKNTAVLVEAMSKEQAAAVERIRKVRLQATGQATHNGRRTHSLRIHTSARTHTRA